MSLQDDIFDIAAELEGKPESAAFERLLSRLNDAEEGEEAYYKLESRLLDGARLFKQAMTAISAE